MARVAITEYAAKRLVFGDAYQGVSVTPETVSEEVTKLDTAQHYIVKVDVGIKKRGKQGLVRVNVAASEVAPATKELFDLGHERCIIEAMVPHKESDEQYLSIDLVREGALILQSDQGGVEIESRNSTVNRTIIPTDEVLKGIPTIEVKGVPLPLLLEKMQEYHFSFLEINPYIIRDNDFLALDMAVEIDSSKENRLPEWVQGHVLHKKVASSQEAAVLEQDARTQAALNLHTLNPNGSVLTLLSGGGASLVGLDSLVTAGLQNEVINYSEYSGAPTREETHVYVNTLLEVLFNSTATNKVILIAGGVANFTDVMATFQGIVDAFTDQLATLKEQGVYVCVRRGGPNQEAGLAHLRDFLDQNGISNDVNGPSLSLGEVGNLVKPHLQ